MYNMTVIFTLSTLYFLIILQFLIQDVINYILGRLALEDVYKAFTRIAHVLGNNAYFCLVVSIFYFEYPRVPP